jgi:prophage regulatory protein
MKSRATTSTVIAERILRPRVVEERIGLSLTTIWRQRRLGQFPEPIRLSPGCVGWRESDIQAWLAARMGKST